MENLLIKCARCGAKNRVPKNRVRDRAICGKCRHPLSPDHFYPDHAVDITDATFEREVPGFPGSTVVFVWSPSCGYCQRMMPIMDQLASQYAGRIKFARLISEQNPVTASRYQVQGVPTLLYFKNGRQVDRTVGALSREEVERLLYRLL